MMSCRLVRMSPEFHTLLAAVAVVVAVGFVLGGMAVLGNPARDAPGSTGRVRLPVRAFERLASCSIALGVGAVSHVAFAGDGLMVSALVAVAALVWLTRRGSFAALTSAEGNAHG